MTREYFDIAVVIPLEEELAEFLEHFPSVDDRSTSTDLRHVVDSGQPGIRIIVALQEDMGRTMATRAASEMLHLYDVGLLVCIGIAGSLSADMRLGDVCYTGHIIDVYDNTKVTDGKTDGVETEFSPDQYRTPREVTAALNFMRNQPVLKPVYSKWQDERSRFAERLLQNAVPGRGDKLERLGAPNTKNGTLICGAVSKSDAYNKKLRGLERKALAIETESGGVFAEAGARKVDALTIRGISDYADRGKGDLEAASRGAVRKIAASNAVSFFKLQLINPNFNKYLNDRQRSYQGELTLLEATPTENTLANVIGNIGLFIDSNLRKLCPEFKLQPKGYKLPVPRIRDVSFSIGADPKAQSQPTEIIDALALNDRIVIKLPRTYPDQSLAWVLADELMNCEVGSMQVVPIVVDGQDIKSKRQGLISAISLIVTDPGNVADAQLVIIIENLPLRSTNRLNVIVDQIQELPRAKFIFVAKEDGNLINESEFVTRSGSKLFDVCDISFSEISHFVQKNFAMSGSEADVVALRLHNTFSRFHLNAHPSYFAGIPRETLSALLHANKRSELIQLAVDGFLTFIVADDRQEVSLSRSTRSRFLRRLVVEMKVKNRTFDESSLVAFTKEFALKHDFDINPIGFIESFFSHGIMYANRGQVQISLQFIESYLLAAELAVNQEEAASYFKIDSEEFDFLTFDLYAEIGASDEIVNLVLAKLSTACNLINKEENEVHVLLTNKIIPASLKNPVRADAFRLRLKKAAEQVNSPVDNTGEKQALLDVAETVRLATVEQSKEVSRQEKEKNLDKNLQPLDLAVRHWVAATVLLGAGAEHLEADVKRKLSAGIVTLASSILHYWLSTLLQVDFSAIKVHLTSDEVFDSFPGDASPDEKKKLISGLVDLMEMSILMQPISQIIGFLCEQARLRVLATSLEHAELHELVDSAIRATWLADIDSRRGRVLLRNAIRDLPAAPFFRLALATFYMSRVYWHHWQSDARLVLLDAAEEAIKGNDSLQFDKAKAKRLIQRTGQAVAES